MSLSTIYCSKPLVYSVVQFMDVIVNRVLFVICTSENVQTTLLLIYFAEVTYYFSIITIQLNGSFGEHKFLNSSF